SGTPSLSCSRTPSSAQSACRHPEDQYHFPATTRPPSTRLTSEDGENTPATRASGVFLKTSSCARSGNSPVNQAQTLVRATTQAEEPHASATAAVTSICVRIDPSYPPYRLGTMVLKRPASARAWIFSSTTLLSFSVCVAFLERIGCSALARATNVDLFAASSWKYCVSGAFTVAVITVSDIILTFV